MVADKGITWPQLWEAGDYDARVPKLFAVDGTPLLYLVDRGGRLAGRFGSLASLERELPEVLASPADLPRAPRDQWQRPNALMDQLGIRRAATVADIGAGQGYLTRHLAHRVGAEGKVYAVDIDEKALASLKQTAQAEGLRQVETVLGAADDPRLPDAALDAAIIVDSYHEFTAPEAMLRRIHATLRAGGRLGILERTDALGRARSEYQGRHRLPPEVVIEDVARHGLRLKAFASEFTLPSGDSVMYLLVFEKPS